MRSLSSLGGKVRKKSGSELDSNRYSYLSLDQAEPDFGIPDSDKSILLSDADGSRLFGKFSNGLTVDANGIITGDESTFEINTSGYSYSAADNLARVLRDLDSALALATAGELITIQTDGTLNGAGTVGSPLSVDSNNILTIVDLRVSKAFVDGLNVDADTLDSQDGSYYLDYTNFTNKPNILDSGNVIATITGAGFATQSFVNISIDSAVAALVNSSPEQLDTLSELAAALNNDSDFANTITTLIGTKVSIADFTTYFNANFDTRSTDSLSEGLTNLYYTTARADSAFDDRLATKTTTDLAEGINLYFTTGRADSAFDARLATKTTDDLAEGSTNKYYLKSRVDSDIIALVDNAYIDARIAIDSAFIAGLIDSAYVASIISEDYVKAIADSAYITGIVDATYINSLVDSVDEATNALTLNNQPGSFYLDYTNFTNKPLLIDSAAIRNLFSASGDLTYDSAKGQFSIDVEQSYTSDNFDSDLDAAIDVGSGLTYNPVTNTISINDTNVVPGTYGSNSLIPIITVNSRGQIDSIGTALVGGVSSVLFDSNNAILRISTTDGSVYTAPISIDAFSTTDLTEGDNLYYTQARVDSDLQRDSSREFIRSLFSAAGDLNYSASTGTFDIEIVSIVDSAYINSRIDVTATIDSDYVTDIVNYDYVANIIDSDYVFDRAWRFPTGDYGSVDSATTDAFGVSVGPYYDMMDPSGDFRSVDLGTL